MLDALVQSRLDRRADKQFLGKLIRKQARLPRVLVTDKLGSYCAARKDMGIKFEHCQHKKLNNRAENSHQPTRRREGIMKLFKSARHLQRFVSIHDPIANLYHFPRHSLDVPIPMKAPVFNGIIPPGDSGIMAPPCNGVIPPGRRVPSAGEICLTGCGFWSS